MSVECGIGKVDTSDVRGKLDAKCTTLFYQVSVYHVTSRDKGDSLWGNFGSTNGTQCGVTQPARHSRQHFSMSSTDDSGAVVDSVNMAPVPALDVSTVARAGSRVGRVWLSINTSAPMSMAIFAASDFASFFFAKTGCVAYERCAPSGLVIVTMHCLSVAKVSGRCKDMDVLTL